MIKSKTIFSFYLFLIFSPTFTHAFEEDNKTSLKSEEIIETDTSITSTADIKKQAEKFYKEQKTKEDPQFDTLSDSQKAEFLKSFKEFRRLQNQNMTHLINKQIIVQVVKSNSRKIPSVRKKPGKGY